MSRSAASTPRGRVEEYAATFDDDDMEFVGALDARRAVHAERRRPEPEAAAATRNNIGDVWVVADLHSRRDGARAAAGARASARDRAALHANGISRRSAQ